MRAGLNINNAIFYYEHSEPCNKQKSNKKKFVPGKIDFKDKVICRHCTNTKIIKKCKSHKAYQLKK